jgi:vacuolar-type H+-ATPase subunit E/Vma4
MSRVGLIESLQRRAAEEATAVWDEARAEAARQRLAAAHEVEQQRAALAQRLSATAARAEHAATAEAERRARDIRMGAAIALGERLYGLALQELRDLREQREERLFEALAGELPARAWQKVRVNPADEARARQRFPQATVESDARISGGLESETENGRVRVSNTLEARLATAWPDLLPGLIGSLVAESSDHQPPA